MNVSLSLTSANVAFLDLSHYVFHRFYAIQTWCRVSGVKIDDDDNYIERFDRLFISNLVKIRNKFGVDWRKFYIAKDCTREHIWRMKLFPEYKKNRDDREKDPLLTKIFKYVYEVLLPRMQDIYGVKIVGYAQAEADDVIAVLVRKLRRDESHLKILVVTNDTDYLQLVGENVCIMNSNFKEIKEKMDPDIALAGKYVQWKVIKGDPSDNIPSIDGRLGTKLALKLALDEIALEDKLASNPAIRDRYERNNTLINFDCIPVAMRLGIEELYP